MTTKPANCGLCRLWGWRVTRPDGLWIQATRAVFSFRVCAGPVWVPRVTSSVWLNPVKEAKPELAQAA